MKKYILLVTLSVILLFTSDANAVLTNQAPAKYKKVNTPTSAPKIKYSTPNNVIRNEYKVENTEIENYKKKIAETLDADVAKWRPLNWGTELSTVIEFGIAENGRVNYSTVTKTSGQFWFDDSAKYAVYKTYDPLPASFQGTCPKMEDTSYRGKCLVMTYTFKK